jgi:hydrogenase maturation protease
VGPLIAGCGTEGRGDDAAGLLVARRLRALGIPAIEHGGEGLALLESWSGAAHVILVDAVRTGANAGAVTVWDASAKPVTRDAFSVSTHAFGVAEAIELGRTLGRLPASLIVYGIEATRFEAGAGPQQAVLDAVERVARRIVEETSQCMNPE